MTIKKSKIEKFSLQTIADAVRGSDLTSARSALAFAVGAVLDVSGRVQKVVKREGKFKLVIEPSNIPGFFVFAEFLDKFDTLKMVKIRKGSAIELRGKLKSFGGRAVCLYDCRLRGKVDEVETKKTTKEQRKNRENCE